MVFNKSKSICFHFTCMYTCINTHKMNILWKKCKMKSFSYKDHSFRFRDLVRNRNVWKPFGSTKNSNSNPDSFHYISFKNE